MTRPKRTVKYVLEGIFEAGVQFKSSYPAIKDNIICNAEKAIWKIVRKKKS